MRTGWGLWVGLVLGCTGGEADPPGTEAASDAAPLDAAPDAAPLDAAPDAQPPDAALLLGVEEVATVDRETLQGLVDPAVPVSNGYTLSTLTIRSAGRQTRVTVAVPDTAPPPGGWHIVANAHGTTGGAAHCGLAGTAWAFGNAGLFGARGLVGVAPEYPGLGGEGVHPYLVTASEARAVLDAVRATLAFADARAIPLSGRAAFVGFSQGGHAALSAAARYDRAADGFDLRGVAVAAPASVWPEHWSAGLAFDGPHLAYHALLTWSWSKHYRIDLPLWAEGVDAEALFSTRCLFGPDGLDTLSEALPQQAAALFDPAWLRAWQTMDWPRPFEDAFSANRVAPFAQPAPIRVYQGDADQVVPAWQTEELVAALRAGGMSIEYEAVAGGRHDDVAFGVLAIPQRRTEAALAWLMTALGDP